MIPTWIVGITLMIAMVVGFACGLTWQGRSHRSAHSFYDPAVSVSATIERAIGTPIDDEPAYDEPDDDEQGDDEQGDDEPGYSDEYSDDGPETDTYSPLETDGPVVRYYFAEQEQREKYDPHKTVRIRPVQAPQPNPQTPRPRTGARERPSIGHAFRKHAATAHPVRKQD